MVTTKPFKHEVTTKRLRRRVIGPIHDCYAVTSPGVEAICRREMTALGLNCRDASPETGGVAFKGRFVDCQRANLHLRTATRILMRITTFSATNPRQLIRRCAAIPWELFIPAGQMPGINVTSRRSRLYHTDLVADTVREGLTSRLGSPLEPQKNDFPQTLFARLVKDRVTFSLDSSGEPLYKRGLKIGPARAPLRETLAAAILLAAGYDGRRPLVDPMCGSGTFSLEAAMLAKRMAPGGRRRFAFMNWPAFGERQWVFLKREAEMSGDVLHRPLIHASDLDANACKGLSEAADRNGLSDAINVSTKDFFDCNAGQYGGGPGLVTINPPYGIRIGSERQAMDLFQRICRHLKAAFSGWDVALIVPHKTLLKSMPCPTRQVPLAHGGLNLTLCLGKIKDETKGLKAKRLF